MKALVVVICLLFVIPPLSFAQEDPDPNGPFTLGAGIRNIPGIHVYDADNQYLGLLINTGSVLVLYSFILQKLINIDPYTGTLQDTTLFFEAQDCSGTAFMKSTYMYSHTQNNGLYYTGSQVAPVKMKTFSQLEENGNCSKFSWDTYFVPAVEVSRSSLGFDTPIALPLKFKAKIKPVPR